MFVRSRAKECQFKGGTVKDGPASRREDLKGGRQQQHTHAESGGLIKKVICAAGGEKKYTWRCLSAQLD